MKGKVILRFVGNRQEPEPCPESTAVWPSFSKDMLYPMPLPEVPFEFLAYQKELFEKMHAITCPFYKARP